MTLATFSTNTSLERIWVPLKGRLDPIQRGNKETGMGLSLLKRLTKSSPGDPLRQVDNYFAKFKIPAGTGIQREASLQTRRDYIKRLKSSIRDLPSLNIKIQNLTEPSRTHMTHLLKKWVKEVVDDNYLVRRSG